ncbi:hypothetical protein AXI64_gp207 [Vibrio phage qdvp001]|uniref:hypothetical protein n=1 Tax=Vibrio phage qdvp001 TaxID=1003177 RepID=UPI00071EC5BB|nr:hypothetical protein AXI64_gp207 [Vibrio phage qdvp001]ALM62199.1 hypothetical protein qdvp001_207 [Vibrio phage qdvp001]
MTKRNSDDVSILIRSSELLSEMLDEMITESYIAPETLINYHENLMKCKRAVKVIKERQL